MKILALEFSSDRRGVAVVDTAVAGGGTATAEVQREGRTTLACAMIDVALRRAGLRREEIDTLALGLGPGSYMGIRMAIALAQGWRLARDLRLIGLSSLECLAAQWHATGATGPVLVATNAQRNECYLAGYQLEAAGWRETEPLRLASDNEVERRRQAGAVVIGPDLPTRITGAQQVFPDAATLARLAVGRAEFPPDAVLEPITLRPVSFVKATPHR